MNARLVLVVAAVIAIGSRPGFAHQDPPGCFQTGTAIIVQTFRSDGTTGIVGSIQDCEQIFYRVTLQKAQNTTDICAFSGGTFTLTTPDGVPHVVSNSVPCIGGTDSAEGCTAATTSLQSGLISYTASPADVSGAGFVTATAVYTGGVSHDTASNTAGLSASTSKSTPVVACGVTTSSTSSSTTTTTLPKSACTATKLTTATKLALALAKCDAKGVKVGLPAVQACRDKAIAKFTTKWTSLETKPDCFTTGDQVSIQDLIDACTTSLLHSLVPYTNP
jgi:hypothetical protein